MEVEMEKEKVDIVEIIYEKFAERDISVKEHLEGLEVTKAFERLLDKLDGKLKKEFQDYDILSCQFECENQKRLIVYVLSFVNSLFMAV